MAKRKVITMLPYQWAALKLSEKEFSKVRNDLQEGWSSPQFNFNVNVSGRISVGYQTNPCKPIDYRLLFAHVVSEMSVREKAALRKQIEEGIAITEEELNEAADLCRSLQEKIIRRGSITGSVQYTIID